MATIKFRRGAGQPTGLTAYEPAWDTTNNRLFVNNGSTAVWVGAPIVNDGTLSGNCAWTVPTQFSVKSYVDSQVAGGAVSSVNGATGAITIAGGTGINISTAGRGITLFNAGVLSVNGTTGAVTNVAFTNTAQTFSAVQTFTSGMVVTNGLTLSDVLRIRGTITDPGGRIELWDESNTYRKNLVVETNAAKGATFTFGGADGFVVAANTDGATSGWIVRASGGGLSPTWINPASAGFSAYQSNRADNLLIVDSTSGLYYPVLSGGKTGYQPQYSSNNVTWNETTSLFTTPNLRVTAGLTAADITTTGSVNVGTNVTVSGNLTVNGTTTTVNSTTVTIQDPLIAIGGVTANAPPPVGDTKDRGVVFQWATGVAGQTGFFGFDQSTQRFTFIPIGAAVSGEIVSGAAGNAEFSGVFAPSGTLTLQGTSGANAVITLAGNTAGGSTIITNTAFETLLTSSTGVGRLSLRSDIIDPSLKGTLVPDTLTAARTYTLPDISGTLVPANTAGATSGWLLRGQGSATQNTWINPNAAGFTAFTTTNVNLVGVKDSGSYGLIFALGTAGNQILYGDSTTGIAWQPSTNTLTVGSGTGKLEGVVDGGAF